MRMRDVLCGLLAGMLITGCSSVMSTRPVGEAPLALVSEEWSGTWTDSEGFLEVRVVDPEAGRIEAAWIETHDSGFELERVEVSLRSGGDAVFANVLESANDDGDAAETVEGGAGDEAAPLFAFVRVAREGDKLVLWWPEVEAFRELVEAGKLPGKVTDGKDVVLDQLSSGQLGLLTSDDSASLYDWKDPRVLLRTGNR